MRTTLYAAATLVSCVTWANPCAPVAEYAQLKDRARSAQGRESLAADYCLYAQLRRNALTRRDDEQCAANQSKIVDALKSAGDTHALGVALSGCPTIYGAKPGGAPAVYRCNGDHGASYRLDSSLCDDGSQTIAIR